MSLALECREPRSIDVFLDKRWLRPESRPSSSRGGESLQESGGRRSFQYAHRSLGLELLTSEAAREAHRVDLGPSSGSRGPGDRVPVREAPERLGTDQQLGRGCRYSPERPLLKTSAGP